MKGKKNPKLSQALKGNDNAKGKNSSYKNPNSFLKTVFKGSLNAAKNGYEEGSGKVGIGIGPITVPHYLKPLGGVGGAIAGVGIHNISMTKIYFDRAKREREGKLNKGNYNGKNTWKG